MLANKRKFKHTGAHIFIVLSEFMLARVRAGIWNPFPDCSKTSRSEKNESSQKRGYDERSTSSGQRRSSRCWPEPWPVPPSWPAGVRPRCRAARAEFPSGRGWTWWCAGEWRRRAPAAPTAARSAVPRDFEVSRSLAANRRAPTATERLSEWMTEQSSTPYCRTHLARSGLALQTGPGYLGRPAPSTVGACKNIQIEPTLLNQGPSLFHSLFLSPLFCDFVPCYLLSPPSLPFPP